MITTEQIEETACTEVKQLTVIGRGGTGVSRGPPWRLEKKWMPIFVIKETVYKWHTWEVTQCVASEVGLGAANYSSARHAAPVLRWAARLWRSGGDDWPPAGENSASKNGFVSPSTSDRDLQPQ